MEGLNEIIVGNVCSLCACVTDSVSGAQKKRSRILGVQILSQVFYAAGSIILKGYSSTAQNVVAVLRNLAAMKNVRHRAVEWTLIALGVVLGIVGIVLNHNVNGWLDWLPIAANLEYSVAVFRFRDGERKLKLAFIANMLMFSVFDFAIKNFVGAAACIVVAVITAVSLIRGAGKKPGKGDGGEEQ